MSWKGLQKVMSRLPHQIMSKKSDVTRDADFIQLETRFNDCTKVVTSLKSEGQMFRDSVSALLSHQSEMASYLSLIYSTQIGVEIEEGGVQRRIQPTQTAALQAANDAEAAMAYCRDEILPELDSIDHYVIRPAQELQEIVKTIQKTIVKRNHKLIDYDRYRVSLHKLTSKTERTLSEEKSIFKIQSQLDTATQDYDYLNNALKTQLPIFFRLQFDFIQPIFEHMFHLQCKIFGMIYARCYELLTANDGHFVTHEMAVDAGFQWRLQQFNAQTEIENMDLLKAGGKAWLSVSGAGNSSKLTLQERAAIKQQAEHSQQQQQQPLAIGYQHSSPPQHEQPSSYQIHQPPPQQPVYPLQQHVYDDKPTYSQNTNYRNQQQPYEQEQPPPPAYAQTSSSASGGGGLVTPRPPVPAPPPSRTKYVLALYDYDAQAEGDLSFRQDDKIELVKRTDDVNDWWTGKLRGQVGVFPGNYVSII